MGGGGELCARRAKCRMLEPRWGEGYPLCRGGWGDQQTAAQSGMDVKAATK